MTFVQIIDYKTSRYDDLSDLMDRYVAQSQGKRTVTHSMIGKDRERADHYLDVVEFPSYEEAMKNSQLPETDRMFKEMVALCDEMPTFTNLDVVRDEQLNKHLVNRLFDVCIVNGNLDALEECVATNHIDHDVSHEATTVIGLDPLRKDIKMWRGGFDMEFEIACQLAEGDLVTTVWTWHGTHKGDFMGMAATGKKYDIQGTTTCRILDGLIAETWWHYDIGRLMREMGAPGS
ncbi:ester cyclase [Streptomyces bambusae]|uniref:Ester cyclase n=1 Tax=Streptomyces bambusae TaxID=1550616 RepID=A0ABS6Z139_9ACTN|nr:ester cyclase [Streptomyces bambusae]MBW5481432.1 ester cyclase [Streptomyces bambusae]